MSDTQPEFLGVRTPTTPRVVAPLLIGLDQVGSDMSKVRYLYR